jgi:uncharacterized membrane-anchored protein
MTIENTTVRIVVLIIITILYVKFWRITAERIGERLGIGRVIVKFFSKNRDDK